MRRQINGDCPYLLYQLPKYHLTDWWVRNSDGTYSPRADQCAACEFAQLNISARNAPDWTFRYWFGGATDIPIELDPSIANELTIAHHLEESQGQTVLLAAQYDLYAVFKNTPLSEYIPELADIVGEAYALCNLSTYEEYFSLETDIGKSQLTSEGIWEPRPDGIPDYAQFSMLQEILENKQVDLGKTGHVAYWEIWRIFSNQYTILTNQLGSVELDDRTMFAVTALLTMGTSGHRYAAKRIVGTIAQVDLDLSDFEITANRWLASTSNSNGVGRNNRDLWRHVAAATEPAPAIEEMVAAYVYKTTTGDEDESDPSLIPDPMIPPDPSPEDSCEECWNGYGITKPQIVYDDKRDVSPPYQVLASVTQAEAERGGCPIPPETLAVELTKGTLSPPPASACPTAPSEGQNSVQSGKIVMMTARPESNKRFAGWNIPGSIMNGSIDLTVQFPNSRSASGVITPVVSPTGAVWVLKNGCDISVPASDVIQTHSVDVPVERFYPLVNSYLVVTGPLGMSITITGTAPEGRTIDGWAVHSAEDTAKLGGGFSRGYTLCGSSVEVLIRDAIVKPTMNRPADSQLYRRCNFSGTINNADSAVSSGLDAIFKSRAGCYIPIPENWPTSIIQAPTLAWAVYPNPGYVLEPGSLIVSPSLDSLGRTWSSAYVRGTCIPMAKLDLTPAIHEYRASGAPESNPECAGEIVASPASAFYLPKQIVELRANPYYGYAFCGWTSSQNLVAFSSGTNRTEATRVQVPHTLPLVGCPATRNPLFVEIPSDAGSIEVVGHFAINCYHEGTKDEGYILGTPQSICGPVNAPSVNGRLIDADTTGEKYGCAHDTLHALRKAASGWREDAQPISVTAIAMNPPAFAHGSHRNGLAIDVRYISAVTTVPGPVHATNAGSVHREKTIEMLRRIINNGKVSYVIVHTDTNITGADLGVTVLSDRIRYDDNHYHHAHVQFEDVDGG